MLHLWVEPQNCPYVTLHTFSPVWFDLIGHGNLGIHALNVEPEVEGTRSPSLYLEENCQSIRKTYSGLYMSKK